MKIVVTKRFLDISLDREVEVGEVLEISPERYEEMQINAAALDDVYFKVIDTAQTIAEEGTSEATANEPDSETTDTAAEKGADELEKKAKGRGKKSSK